MGTLALPHRMTPEEYLEQENKAEFRSEYSGGIVFAMAGGTRIHSLISTNVSHSLHAALAGSACEVHNSELRIWIPAAKAFCYPDALVACDPLRYFRNRSDAIENPRLVVEVLSESSETYDRGQKFRKYRSIPDLRQYVLISQKEPLVEVFTRTDQGFWLLREYAGLDAVADLDSVSALLPLRDTYYRVDFEPVPE